MPATERLTLDLPVETVRSLRAHVAEGGFASEADVIAAAIAGWDDAADDDGGYSVAELRELINEGRESGPSIESDVMFARLRARLAARRS